MLPASKDDFPKCLYLDQNKLIDLARAHYDRPGGDPFGDALRAIRGATRSGRLVVPFSWIGVAEAIASADAGRRERLARFMVELSGDHTVLPEASVCPLEIKNALSRLFGRGRVEAVRPLVVRRGVAHAVGLEFLLPGTSEGAEAARTHLGSPDATVDFLLAAGEKREDIDRIRAAEVRAVAVLDRFRSSASSLGPEQRRVVAFGSMFSSGGTHAPDLLGAMESLGLTFEEFTARVGSAEAVASLAADIPNIDIFVTLTLARNQDLVRPIHRNDLRDLDWLSVALAYSNAVVSENFWGHQVRATGLDEKYGTRLLTDLRELPRMLRQMGCIA